LLTVLTHTSLIKVNALLIFTCTVLCGVTLFLNMWQVYLAYNNKKSHIFPRLTFTACWCFIFNWYWVDLDRGRRLQRRRENAVHYPCMDIARHFYGISTSSLTFYLFDLRLFPKQFPYGCACAWRVTPYDLQPSLA
jgi:hypothetical protein